MILGTRFFPVIQKIHATGMPYKTCRKWMAPLAEIFPQTRKLVAVRIPYKTCRKPMIWGPDFFWKYKKSMLPEFLIKPV